MASSSFTRCPSALPPSCFRCSSVRLWSMPDTFPGPQDDALQPNRLLQVQANFFNYKATPSLVPQAPPIRTPPSLSRNVHQGSERPRELLHLLLLSADYRTQYFLLCRNARPSPLVVERPPLRCHRWSHCIAQLTIHSRLTLLLPAWGQQGSGIQGGCCLPSVHL